jgi:type I restriction enzyme S subunit
MENWRLEILENLVDIDSEQLGNTTDKDYLFYYIDIGSVSSGMILFPSFPTTFNEAPSRARKILQNGDILMSSVRPNLKAFARFNSEDTNSQFVASTGFAVLRVKKGTDIDYIYHSLFSSPIENQITSLVVGSNYPALNTRDIRKLKVYLPQSKIEQTKIASILNLTDEGIAQTKKLVDKYHRIKLGLQQDLLTKGIDVKGNIRSKTTHKFVIKKGIEVPVEWNVNTVKDVLDDIEQGWSPDCEGEEAPTNEWGVLKTTSVTWEGFNEKENKRLPQKLIPKVKYEIKSNDVLITRAGPNSRVGVVAHVKTTRSKLILSDKLYRLIPNSKIVPEFLALALSNPNTQRHLSNLKTGMAESQTNISQAIIKALIISLPNVDEQKMIIQYLNGIEAVLTDYKFHLKKLYAIKTGLMQDLLSGKVRVK